MATIQLQVSFDLPEGRLLSDRERTDGVVEHKHLPYILVVLLLVVIRMPPKNLQVLL